MEGEQPGALGYAFSANNLILVSLSFSPCAYSDVCALSPFCCCPFVVDWSWEVFKARTYYGSPKGELVECPLLTLLLFCCLVSYL